MNKTVSFFFLMKQIIKTWNQILKIEWKIHGFSWSLLHVTCFAFDFLRTKRIAGNDVVSGLITALVAASPHPQPPCVASTCNHKEPFRGENFLHLMLTNTKSEKLPYDSWLKSWKQLTEITHMIQHRQKKPVVFCCALLALSPAGMLLSSPPAPGRTPPPPSCACVWPGPPAAQRSSWAARGTPAAPWHPRRGLKASRGRGTGRWWTPSCSHAVSASTSLFYTMRARRGTLRGRTTTSMGRQYIQ